MLEFAVEVPGFGGFEAFEAADPTEVAGRMHAEVFVTQLEVPVGSA